MTGHAVRAAYLFSGVADIAAETGDSSLLAVCRAIREDLTQHQMYITAGVGSAHTNEGFTFPYDLPNETAYAETCAAIALVFLAQRLFRLDPDSRYIDVMERALYNGVLSGVSFEGGHFFYTNPLAPYPNVNPYERWSGIQADQYYRHSGWFDCTCCPPNLARLVADIGSYFYATTADTLYVHLYNPNRTYFKFGGNAVHIEQRTNYPWDGTVQIRVDADQSTRFELALRVPNRCHDFRVALNGVPLSASLVNGYARIRREWAKGGEVTLELVMPVESIVAHPFIRQDAGYIALQRGPVVYCLEEVDNGCAGYLTHPFE